MLLCIIKHQIYYYYYTQLFASIRFVPLKLQLLKRCVPAGHSYLKEEKKRKILCMNCVYGVENKTYKILCPIKLKAFESKLKSSHWLFTKKEQSRVCVLCLCINIMTCHFFSHSTLEIRNKARTICLEREKKKQYKNSI